MKVFFYGTLLRPHIMKQFPLSNPRLGFIEGTMYEMKNGWYPAVILPENKDFKNMHPHIAYGIVFDVAEGQEEMLFRSLDSYEGCFNNLDSSLYFRHEVPVKLMEKLTIDLNNNDISEETTAVVYHGNLKNIGIQRFLDGKNVLWFKTLPVFIEGLKSPEEAINSKNKKREEEMK